MSVFTFSRLELPSIEYMMAGKKYERMKKTLLALLISQRVKVFDAEGGASGKWKALSPSTMEIRQEKLSGSDGNGAAALKGRGAGGSDIKILQDSGLLRSSFTGQAYGPAGTEGVALHEESIEGDEVSISTPVEYARIQNDGGTIKNGFGKGIEIVIPPRPFDEFSEEDKGQISELLEHYLNG